MKIIVNDESCDTQATSVAELVLERGLNPDRVAVVLNEAVLPAAARGSTRLKDGDRVELLSFAGGGSGPRALNRKTGCGGDSAQPSSETVADYGR